MCVEALRAPTGLALPEQPSWGSPMAQDPFSPPGAISPHPSNAALPWALPSQAHLQAHGPSLGRFPMPEAEAAPQPALLPAGAVGQVQAARP